MALDLEKDDVTNVILFKPRGKAGFVYAKTEGPIDIGAPVVFTEPSIRGLGDYVIIDPNWLAIAAVDVAVDETATRAAHRRQESALVGVFTTVLSQMIETFGYEWTQRTLAMEITALGLNEDQKKD